MENEDFLKRIEFTFGNFLFHTTQKEETFAEARKTCLKDGSKIANLNGINYENFSETFLKAFSSNWEGISDLRVHSFGGDYPECYGLLDTKTGLTEGFLFSICEGTEHLSKYHTLCSSEIKNVEHAFVSVVLIFLMVTALMTVFVYYFSIFIFFYSYFLLIYFYFLYFFLFCISSFLLFLFNSLFYSISFSFYS